MMMSLSNNEKEMIKFLNEQVYALAEIYDLPKDEIEWRLIQKIKSLKDTNLTELELYLK